MLTRAQMETTKITKNINLTTLARTNQGSIPLPVTLTVNKQPGHKWDGCPSLHIGNSSGWYLFTLCEDGLKRFEEDTLSIWGDYQCLNIYDILVEACQAVGWDFSDEVLPPVIEKSYTTEIRRNTCPWSPDHKWQMIITDISNGEERDNRWKKTRKEAEKELEFATSGGKSTVIYWRGNQKYIEHFREVGQ